MKKNLLTIRIAGIGDNYIGKCKEFKVGSFGNSRRDVIQRVQTAILINSMVMLRLYPKGIIKGYYKKLLPYARKIVKNKENLESLFMYT